MNVCMVRVDTDTNILYAVYGGTDAMYVSVWHMVRGETNTRPLCMVRGINTVSMCIW